MTIVRCGTLIDGTGADPVRGATLVIENDSIVAVKGDGPVPRDATVIEAALLPALIGPGRAPELLLTGQTLTASQASECGLVNRVAPVDRVEAVTLKLLGRIFECAPTAVRNASRSSSELTATVGFLPEAVRSRHKEAAG